MGTLENTWGKWEKGIEFNKKKRKMLSENIFNDKP